ncbi:hypothetical protein H5V45_21290 [Nocardioides sp. KIGAM211]|uniref:Uncharacterized protein n=1 Tax=Nocardioides luti TaxID=2761101 RepID=A0A7X0RK94_9ACTN|nr:hypothetical protein [Nocardioides luti]MBB6629866.1 hypothetical protein [Nocardioides luti]
MIGLAVVVLVAGIGIAATLLLGANSGDEKASGDTLRGTAILFDPDGSVEGSWDDCKGTGGYSDFGEGMRLSVKGKSDEIVGTGNVVNVTEANLEDVVRADWGSNAIGLTEKEDLAAAVDELRDFLESGEGLLCLLYFEADIEPSTYYSVELADRGDLSYSQDELRKKEFAVGFSLGDF